MDRHPRQRRDHVLARRRGLPGHRGAAQGGRRAGVVLRLLLCGGDGHRLDLPRRSSWRSSPTRCASASCARAEYLRLRAAAPMSATMIEGYRHRPGNHCGSTALRNLLAFDGIEISEEMALGLGAGVCFYYVPLEGESPSRFTNGRVGRLEEQFLELTGAELRLETFDEPEDSWQAAREAVDGGRPALLLTDLYYLDHYGRSAHFPGHAVVLAGYDERGRLPLGHRLRGAPDHEARAPRRGAPRRAPRVPARGPDADRARPGAAGRPAPGRGGGDRAQRPADARAGDGRVRGPPGAAALRGRARPTGRSLLEDWQWSSRFCYQVIERRGTGGGNFRLMYSRFLAEAGPRRGGDRRRGRGGVDVAGRRPARGRARPSAPSRVSGPGSASASPPCSRPRSASGRRSPPDAVGAAPIPRAAPRCAARYRAPNPWSTGSRALPP